jgi:prefoldin subunit 5
LNALLSFAGPADTTPFTVTDGRSSAITSCQEKIERWESLRKERSDTLEKLSSDKEMLVARIRSLGCRTKQELMAHSVGCTLAHELEHLSRQIAQLQTESGTIEATVERAQSMLRCIERQSMLKGHGLSDGEFARLAQIDHELQEELRKMTGGPTPGSEVQLDKLLNEVLPQHEQANRCP